MNELMLVRVGELNLVPLGCTRLLVTRYPVKNGEKYGLNHVPALAPSENLLRGYKDGAVDWPTYVSRFRAEMVNMQPVLDKVRSVLVERPVVFVCYCADEHCHRFLLGHYFDEIGVSVRSLGNVKKGIT